MRKACISICNVTLLLQNWKTSYHNNVKCRALNVHLKYTTGQNYLEPYIWHIPPWYLRKRVWWNYIGIKDKHEAKTLLAYSSLYAQLAQYALKQSELAPSSGRSINRWSNISLQPAGAIMVEHSSWHPIKTSRSHLLCDFWEDFLIFSLLKIFISWCCCSFKSCSQCCPHLFQLIYLPCTATWLPPTFTKCLIKKSVASDTVCMVGRSFSNFSFDQLFLFFGCFFWEQLKVTFPHSFM